MKGFLIILKGSSPFFFFFFPLNPLLPSLVTLTLLYIDSEVVIPATAGIQFTNNGFRIKPGMTDKEGDF